MLVHRRKRPRYGVQLPLTSLIDIVFLLLIYFLLTTNFMVEEGIAVQLPQASAAKPLAEQMLTIHVDPQGRVFIDQQPVALDQLFERLKVLLAEDPDRLVVIRADRSVVLDNAVRVMDVAKAAGAGRLLLATERKF
ncbi:MAG: biopolymer transporter ExbD [Desulfobacterales bacterium]